MMLSSYGVALGFPLRVWFYDVALCCNMMLLSYVAGLCGGVMLKSCCCFMMKYFDVVLV